MRSPPRTKRRTRPKTPKTSKALKKKIDSRIARAAEKYTTMDRMNYFYIRPTPAGYPCIQIDQGIDGNKRTGVEANLKSIALSGVLVIPRFTRQQTIKIALMEFREWPRTTNVGPIGGSTQIGLDCTTMFEGNFVGSGILPFLAPLDKSIVKRVLWTKTIRHVDTMPYGTLLSNVPANAVVYKQPDWTILGNYADGDRYYHIRKTIRMEGPTGTKIKWDPSVVIAGAAPSNLNMPVTDVPYNHKYCVVFWTDFDFAPAASLLSQNWPSFVGGLKYVWLDV